MLVGNQLEHFDQLRQRLTAAADAQIGARVEMQTAKRDDKVESRVTLGERL